MRAIIFRTAAGLLGILLGFYGLFMADVISPSGLSIAGIFCAYAILGDELGGQWTKPSS